MKSSKKQKITQTDNNSTEKKAPVKIVDFYTDLFFMKEKPVSEAFIERLATDMVEWAKKDRSLRITQFYNEMGIPSRYFYEWMKHYPKLALAHEYAMSMIADRRDIGAIEKKYDGSYIEKSFGMYDPAYRSFMEWKSKLAKQEQAQGNVQVIIQKFPELEQDEGKRLVTTSNTRSER